MSKDGMLSGPNLELYRTVTGATATPVIASGGVSMIGDLVDLAEALAAMRRVEATALASDRLY